MVSRKNRRELIFAPETGLRDIGVFFWRLPSPDPEIDLALRPLRRSPKFLASGALERWCRL